MAGICNVSGVIAFMLALLCRTSSGYAMIANAQSEIAVRADDPLSAFLRYILTYAQHQLTKGIPILGVPPLDPLELGSLYVDESPIEGFQDLVGDLWNVTVTGLANFEVPRLMFSGLLKPQLLVTLTWPELAVTGHYNLKGKFANSVNFAGNGPFSIKLKSITFTADLLLKVGEGLKVGVEHLDLDLKIKSFISNLQNVLGGGFAKSVANTILSSMLQNHFKTKVRPEVVKAGETLKETLEKLLGMFSIGK